MQPAPTSPRLNAPAFTLNDLHLAGVYWPFLMEQALRNQGRDSDWQLVEYGHLVAMARAAHPADPVVQKAIPTSIGRKLDPVNWFCRQQDLPNLACLAVNANGEPGVGYMRNANWDQELREVARFDWASCTAQFDSYLATTKAARKPAPPKRPQRISDPAARDQWWTWWQAQPGGTVRPTDAQKEKVISLIRDGSSPDAAHSAVTGVASLGAST
jgi:hypothetical protein